MRIIVNKIVLICLVVLNIFFISELKAQWFDMPIGGQCYLVITKSVLTGGAGSNLQSTYTSNQDHVIRSFFKLYWSGGNHQWDWAVDINKTDINQPEDLLVDVRRTSDGQSNKTDYTITDRQTNRNITDAATEFFKGRIRERVFFTYFRAWNIYAQYRVREVSAALQQQTYETIICYTI